ncbi:hypothetical protein PanWU01x14_036740 [Parasponia andersonii]|uniref:Uncharacterized protein n=1 Tax=Parasponia andersonii TaxID=3476 RepID=A0A2P5DSJ4_PARAD|nr:hypothetical protein PanWU01x14_036740 [Parasponia andersonii]
MPYTSSFFCLSFHPKKLILIVLPKINFSSLPVMVRMPKLTTNQSQIKSNEEALHSQLFYLCSSRSSMAFMEWASKS